MALNKLFECHQKEAHVSPLWSEIFIQSLWSSSLTRGNIVIDIFENLIWKKLIYFQIFFSQFWNRKIIWWAKTIRNRPQIRNHCQTSHKSFSFNISLCEIISCHFLSCLFKATTRGRKAMTWLKTISRIVLIFDIVTLRNMQSFVITLLRVEIDVFSSLVGWKRCVRKKESIWQPVSSKKESELYDSLSSNEPLLSSDFLPLPNQ